MMRPCDDRDFELIWAIINDGAQAYKGIIPADRWTEPYMSREDLRRQIDQGVVFWGYEETGTLEAVMGIQQVQDVRPTELRQFSACHSPQCKTYRESARSRGYRSSDVASRRAWQF
jgi:hypothetical protein